MGSAGKGVMRVHSAGEVYDCLVALVDKRVCGSDA